MTDHDDIDKFEDAFPEQKARANKHYAAALADSNSLAVNVWHIGDALLEVKAGLKHGQFGTWLEVNFDGSESKARRYMRLRRKHARVTDLDPELSLTATMEKYEPEDDEDAMFDSDNPPVDPRVIDLDETELTRQSGELWTERGVMQGTDWYRILNSVVPHASKDSTHPKIHGVHLTATDGAIIAVATDRWTMGIAHAESYEGQPFSATIALNNVNSLLASARRLVRKPGTQWRVIVGVGDTYVGKFFGCRFSDSQSFTVPALTEPYVDFGGLFKKAVAAERSSAVRFEPLYLARLAQTPAEKAASMAMSVALGSSATPVQIGDDFVGLIMPRRAPAETWQPPEWLTTLIDGSRNNRMKGI